MEENYNIPFLNKEINIESNIPTVVSPGQVLAIELKLTDNYRQAVENVDITAGSITKKFTTDQFPISLNFSDVPKNRNIVNKFSAQNQYFSPQEKLLNWLKFKELFGLEQMIYYRFLYPENGHFKTQISIKNSCEFAPFVIKNGEIDPIQIIKVDNEPIYFAMAFSNRYSFAIRPGMHKISLRTTSWQIETKEICFDENTKTILSFDPLYSDSSFVAQKKTILATNDELDLLNKHLFWLENNKTDNEVIIRQNDNLFYLKNNIGQMPIGPLKIGAAKYEVPDSYFVNFDFEPNHNYIFKPGLIKMKYRNPIKSDLQLLLNQQKEPNFEELALTGKEIYDEIEDLKKNSQQKFIKNKNPNSTTDGKGKFILRLDKKFSKLDILYKVLFKENDPNFIKIYNSNENEFHELEEGIYSMFVLFKDGKFANKTNLILRKNGYNILNISNLYIQKADNKSKSIQEIIYKSEPFLFEKDRQKIKEVFYGIEEVNMNSFDGEIIKVNGLVKDNEGNEVPGASINIKGTNRGVASDAKGKFTLNCPQNAVLIIASIGYQTKNVIIRNSINISVILEMATNSLEEVVVVGYGVERHSKSLSYSVSSIGNQLMGKAYGVNIRGSNSQNENTDPLIIIDGMPFNGKKSEISLELLKSAELLKGEAATALYGSMAKNGVLIISSKVRKKDINLSQNELNFDNSENQIRRNFNDYAFWQPRIKSDKNGLAKFNVKLPDDITNWQTSFLTMDGKGRTGKKRFETKVFKSITARLSVPNFMVEGDSLEITGLSRNFLNDSILVNTRFSINDKNLESNAKYLKSFTKDSAWVFAKNADTLSIKYHLMGEKGANDGEIRKVPVLEKGTTEAIGHFIYSQKDTSFSFSSKEINKPIKIHIESNPLEIVLDETNKLRNYKYLCNEQLASKLHGLLMAKKLSKILNKPFKADRDIEKIVKKLSENKNSEKLWGWWNIGSTSNWISVHVLDALQEAKKAGFKFEEKDLNAEDILHSFSFLPINSQLEQLNIASKIDTSIDLLKYFNAINDTTKLSFNEKLNYNFMGANFGKKMDINWLKKYEKSTMLGGIYYGEENNLPYQTNVISTLKVAKILFKLKIHPEKLHKIVQYLFEMRKVDGWRNTYESAKISNFLVNYFENMTLPQKGIIEYKVGTETRIINKFPADFQIIANNFDFKLDKKPYFISMSQQFKNSNPVAVSNDFIVKSSLTNKSSLPIKKGQIVTLKLNLEVKKEANYAMLEIPLPAGCEYLLAADTKDIRINNSLSVDYSEKYKEKTNIYFTKIPPGQYQIEIDLVAKFAGNFSLNPAKIELMYFPTFFGRNELKSVRID